MMRNKYLKWKLNLKKKYSALKLINNFAAGTTHCKVIKVRVSAHSFEIGTGHMLLVLRGTGKLSTSSTSEKDPFSDLGDFKV
jgi:hypothetical protein